MWSDKSVKNTLSRFRLILLLLRYTTLSLFLSRVSWTLSKQSIEPKKKGRCGHVALVCIVTGGTGKSRIEHGIERRGLF